MSECPVADCCDASYQFLSQILYRKTLIHTYVYKTNNYEQ